MANRPTQSYSLEELLAQCDSLHPRNEDEQNWLNAPPVGREFDSDSSNATSAAIKAMQTFPKERGVPSEKIQEWLNKGRHRLLYKKK